MKRSFVKVKFVEEKNTQMLSKCQFNIFIKNVTTDPI